MVAVLLLSFGSFACLFWSVKAWRAKPGASESVFLQRDNWVGCALASLGLAVAARHSFLAFCRQYEREHDRGFRFDFGQPAVWILGAFVLGVVCFLAWRRQTGTLSGLRDRKTVLREAAVLAVLAGLVTFGCCVWPTLWRYRTVPVAWDGTLPGPLEAHGQVVTQFRTNRLTGETQAKVGDHWEHEF